MPSPIDNPWQRLSREPTRARRPWRHWLALGVLAAVAGLVVYLRPFPAASYPLPRGAGPLPTLARLDLEPLTGFAKRLTLDDLGGQVVLMHVWGPEYPGCFSGLSQIAEIDQRYRGRSKFRVLLVSCGRTAAPDVSVLSYETAVLMRQANIEMATYTDRSGATRQAIAEAVNISAPPVTLLLDRQGRIHGVWRHRPDDDEPPLGDVVAKLLSQP